MKIQNFEQKKFFEIKEGSNYLITDSFNREEIVEFEQFQKISKSLFTTDADFITINNNILHRRYIYRIEPTKKLTEKQKKENDKKLDPERDEFRRKYGTEPNF